MDGLTNLCARKFACVLSALRRFVDVWQRPLVMRKTKDMQFIGIAIFNPSDNDPSAFVLA